MILYASPCCRRFPVLLQLLLRQYSKRFMKKFERERERRALKSIIRNHVPLSCTDRNRLCIIMQSDKETINFLRFKLKITKKDFSLGHTAAAREG